MASLKRKMVAAMAAILISGTGAAWAQQNEDYLDINSGQAYGDLNVTNDVRINGGDVNFNGDTNIGGSFFLDPSVSRAFVTLANGKTMNIGRDFEMQGRDIGYITKFTLGAGSALNVSQPGYGINIGTSYDGGGTGPSTLFVDGGAPVTITADRYFHIFGHGSFQLDDNAAANITLNQSGAANTHGWFVTGRYAGDLGIVDNNGQTFAADPANFAGGLVKLGWGSALNIRGNAYFGDGSTVDVGLNTVNISGDAVFKSGSTYSLYRSDNASGLISVGGLTTIESGAKVELAGVEGVNAGNKTILTSGNFADGNVFYNPLYQLAIVGNDLVVAGYLGSGETIGQAVGGLGGNYLNGSALIDAILQNPNSQAFLTGRLIGQLETIAALSADGNPAAETAVKQLIGEESLSAFNAGLNTIQQISGALDKRFGALHGFNRAPAAGYGSAANRAWAGGFGNWIRQKSDNRVDGFDYNSGGVMLGYDREIDPVPGLTLGLAGAWSWGKLKNDDGLAKTDVDSATLSLYGSYELGGSFFVDGALGFGWGSNEATTNLVLGGQKRGDFDNQSFMAGLTFGYVFELAPETRLIPSVGLQYTHLKQDGWNERITSDPNNLAVANWYGDTKGDYLDIPLNLRLNHTWQGDSGLTVTPELRLGGVISAKNSDSELHMGFVGAGDSTVIYGVDPGRSRFTVGAGIKVQVNDTVDIFADYDYQGRSGLSVHNASAGLGFSF